MRKLRVLLTTLLLVVLLLPSQVHGQIIDESRFFPETGHTVSGKFLQYWQANGGLATYGYPITDAKDEVDPETGKTFLTQWFERNRFELHPENAGTKFEVLLGLLGKDLKREALEVDPDFARAENASDPVHPDSGIYLAETGHNLRGKFLNFWQQNGGLERFGFPISEEVYELDPETGKAFLVQWFERARFELHPENQPPYDILLGLLGNQLNKSTGHMEYAWKIGSRYEGILRLDKIAIDRKTGYIYGDGDYQRDNLIYKLDSVGRFMLKFPFEVFNNTMAIDLQGNINGLVKDNDVLNPNNRVYLAKLDSSGHLLSKFEIEADADLLKFDEIGGMALDSQNNIYITFVHQQMVIKFNSEGKYLARWSSKTGNLKRFLMPMQLAISPSQDYIYVSYYDGFGVAKFDFNGNFISVLGDEENKDDQPSWNPGMVALDSHGNVYLSNRATIKKYDNQGHLLLEWGDKEILYLGSMALDGNDNIYITGDYKTNPAAFLHKFSPQGQYLGGWGDKTRDISRGMTADGQGNFYILRNVFSNNGPVNGTTLIQKFDSQGHQLPLSSQAFSQSERVSAIAADEKGNLYVNDAGVLKKFDAQGNFLFKFSDTSIELSGLYLAVDSISGYVYGFNSNRLEVVRFDVQGKSHEIFAALTRANLNLPYAYGLALDKQGNVYVALVGNKEGKYSPQIMKFDKQGNLLLTWGTESKLTGVYFLATDNANNVYTVAGSKILKFDNQGHLLQEWEIQEGGFSGFYSAHGGLTIDSQNNVYVAMGSRIHKYQQR